MKINKTWKNNIILLPDDVLNKILETVLKSHIAYVKIVKHLEIISLLNILKKYNLDYKPSSIKKYLKNILIDMNSKIKKSGIEWNSVEFMTIIQYYFENVKRI